MTDPSLNIAARRLIQRLDKSLDGVKLKYAQKAFRRVNGEVIEDSCSAVWILGAPNCFVRTRLLRGTIKPATFETLSRTISLGGMRRG